MLRPALTALSAASQPHAQVAIASFIADPPPHELAVTVRGCLVHDPSASQRKHAFLSTRCKWDLGESFPPELGASSVDLVWAGDEHVEAAPSTCLVVNGVFHRHVGMASESWWHSQGVAPSGSLISSTDLVYVSSIESCP